MQCATPKDVRTKSQETQNLKLWFVAQPETEQCSLKNCYVDMSTTFQLEKEEKQFNVVANHVTLSDYLNEDIFQYRNNIDELTEKLLLLENVDFTSTKNGKFITEIVNHQQQPSMQEKSKNE